MDYEKALTEKNSKVFEIKRIEAEIVQRELEIKKIEETVQLCKTRKTFLDELAVSAGRKQPWVPGTQVPVSAILKQKSSQKSKS